MNQKKRPQIIVTVKKVPQGYLIVQDQEKIDTTTTVRIPKFVVQESPQSKNKQLYTLPHTQNQNSQQQINVPHNMPSPQQLYIYPPNNQLIPNFSLQKQPQQILFQPPPQTYIKPQNAPQPPPQLFIPQHFEIFRPDPLIQIKPSLKIKIPTCSSWFSIDTIHKIEQENFQEYFDQSKPTKTPGLYKKHRNFIINLYQSTPETYLTLTACRRLVPADACSIVHMHGFLNHWGIINNQVDSEQYHGKLIPQPIFPNNFFTKLFEHVKSPDINVINETQIVGSIKNLSERLKPICDSCQMKCSLVWYQQKPIKDVKEIILCIKCFGNNNFPNILSVEDFFKTDIETKLKNVDISQLEQQQKTDELINEKDLSSILTFLEHNPDFSWEDIIANLNTERENKLTGVQILLTFLTYPFQEGSNIGRALETKESLQKLTISDLAARIAAEEVSCQYKKPQFFSDSSNIFACHVALFKKNLIRYSDSKELNGGKIKNECNGEDQIQQNINENTSELFRTLVLQLIKQNALDNDRILQLKDNSTKRAQILIQQEDQKLNESINCLISVQLQKIQQKIAFLEEYEKLILFEKSLLDLSQKQILAERLIVVQQKLQIFNEETNQ